MIQRRLSDVLPCPSNKVIKSDSKYFLALLSEGDTKRSYATLNKQWHRPNVKTSHPSSLFHIESNLDRLGLLSPNHGQRSQQQSGQNTLQSVLINTPKLVEATRHAEIWKIKIPRSMVVGALSWWSRRASQHPAVQSPVHPWKTPHESCPFAAPCWPSWDENRLEVRDQLFPQKQKTSRFAPLILAHRGWALPWLVDDRAAFRPRRIWCVLTR